MQNLAVLVAGVVPWTVLSESDHGEYGGTGSHLSVKILVVSLVFFAAGQPMRRPERTHAREFLRARACPGCGTRLERAAQDEGMVECAECGLAWAEARVARLPPGWAESRRGDLEGIQRVVAVDEPWPCPACRYDLRGLKPDESGPVRCAECGHLCTAGELASMRPRRWRRMKPVRLEEWFWLRDRGPDLTDKTGKKGRLVTPAHLAWLANAAQRTERWKTTNDARRAIVAIGRWERLGGIAAIYGLSVVAIYGIMPWLAPEEFDTQYPLMPGRRFVCSLVLAMMPTGIVAGLAAVVLTRGERGAFRPTELVRDMLIARGVCPHCGGVFAGGALKCGYCDAVWEGPRKSDEEGSTG